MLPFTLDALEVSHQTLTRLADQTGGEYFRLNVGFDAPLKRVEGQTSGYYLITYHAPHAPGCERDPSAPRLIDLRTVRVVDLDVDDAPDERRVCGHNETVFMSSAIENLLTVLDLEPLEVNLFRGRSPQVGWQRVFGGQVIGQALVAACRTVEGRPPHSLHCYFLIGGDPKVPIIYEVDRIRDGKSFTTRRVVAIQHGQAIFHLSASFQPEEQGPEHSLSMPEAPDPESLPSFADWIAPGRVVLAEKILSAPIFTCVSDLHVQCRSHL